MKSDEKKLAAVLDQANIYLTQGSRNADLTALNNGVDLLQKTMADLPEGAEEHIRFLAALADALRGRYVLTRDPDDLNQAIDLGTQGLDDPVARDSGLAPIRSGLSDALRLRYEATRQVHDLDAAIEHGRQAVAETGGRPPQRALRLNTLGLAQRLRAERTDRLSDLNDALGTAQQAVASTRAGEASRALWLAGLSAAATLRYERLGQATDLELAIGAAREGAETTSASPRARAQAARRWAEALAVGQRWPQAVEAYLAALGLLAEAALPEPERAGHQLQLDSLSGLGPDAAACCVRAGEPGRAVEMFERGREVLLGQMAGHAGLVPAAAPTAGELCAAAARGPVVVVIVSRFGSSALILAPAGVAEPVPLPTLTPNAVFGQVAAFLRAMDLALSTGQPRAGEKRIEATLSWLWKAVAGPVLDRLGYHAPRAAGEPWPRVWWCTSGLLSLLPVHAAGAARDLSATVRGRVMSSYTPTIRALIHARRVATPSSGLPAEAERVAGDGHVVAVAIRHTPGYRDLTAGLSEAEWLSAHHPGQVTVLPDEAATREAVLGALPGSQWAHFACHARSDAANPATSALLLRDQPLTVLDVTGLDLTGAELAFLSACSTSHTSLRLADEAITLASAFQLAGYRHVVGTLWPVADRQARETAEQIYSSLVRGRTVASAVHEATRSMSLRWFDMPSRWASHVHVGA
jgi:hypothetical protein